ncbi:MAG TPA: GNAT family N-acetyltransferase [Solirubrobacteraceae bacterium]|nr:GNAT family N-acetyltransferase [Solirubrobacteraceae bacterium]
MSDRAVRPVPIEQTRGLRQALLRPHQTVEEMALDERPGVFAAGAFDGEELVAVGLVAPDGEPGAWRVRGMVTVPEARGRGFGTAVLRALVEHASGQGANLIWCNARTPARAFYEQAGLRVVSDEFELPQIGPHLKMELRLDDREATSTVPRS